ncbi:HWE histidine kinase domain-containing protein [Belnapia moabensis]|uniref:HWE histidine kinase domain-containing protein n=1 Tax=Belnapia moabensis TaxID=365533 RepID=UPI0006948C2E|nr:HWE histidine kinase domain-containing protein [Belnapia moabensis]
MLSATRFQQVILIAAVLVPAAVFGTAAWWNRGEVLRESTATVERTASIMHEHVARVLDTASLVLDRVQDRVETMDDAEVARSEVSDFLAAVNAPLSQIVSVWVADARGYVLAGSHGWDRSTSIADRDFFAVQRDDPGTGTYVSAAFSGRATAVSSVAVSRRRPASDGRFLGTVHVSLNPEYFVHFFREASPPFPHVALLVRSDGALLARNPAGNAPRRLGPESALMSAVARQPEHGLSRGISTIDGADRIFAYRRVGQWPVYVSFGADVDVLLRRWRGNLRAYGVVTLAAALTLLGTAWLALRRARAAEVAEAALAREAAARAAAETSQAAEARFRGVFESRAVGMSVFDLATGETLLCNDRLLEMTGGSRAAFEAGTWDWRRVTPPEHLARDEHAVVEARARGWWSPFEKEYERPDGSRIPVRISSAPLPGEPGRVVVLVEDISEQREAEMRRDLLMREVDHRAKNALATARAALRLTRAPDLPSYIELVDGRITALAQALALLSQTQWQGVDLGTLLRGELAPFLDASRGQVRLEGPALTIGANAVQALAMAVHELATNATKYGALSRAEGRLLLRWEVLAGPPARLRLSWQESGGPPVVEPPKDSGFGTRVLEATLARQLGGSVEQHWEAAGLRCEILLPAARVLAAAEAPGQGSAPASSPAVSPATA